MSFAAIYVPDFPVEAILRVHPELRGQAVAVVEGAPPLVHVIAVNERAALAGVEPGMTKLQAEERLAGDRVIPSLRSGQAQSSGDRVIGPGCDAITRSPDRQITRSLCQRSAPCEAAAHAALLDCACGFSPRVEDTAQDTALLDLAGLERIFGPAAKIARDLARRCSELGLEANVAVACNADAAMHAARGFPGVTVIPPGEEAERLGSLPVGILLATHDAGQSEILNLQSEILETLDRWGVRNLRALAALPEIAVTERLGQEGLRWQKLAQGATSRPLVALEPPLVFEESTELEYPVNELEPLSFLLNRMLEQLCARLAARALSANELRMRLQLDCGIAELQNCRIENNSAVPQFGNSAIHERTLRLPVPMLDAKVFLKLLQLDLQAIPPGAPVMKMWLSATPAEPRRAQDGLFLPTAPEPERLEVTLAKIARVVGKSAADGRRSTASAQNRIGSPEILDTHHPNAFRMNKFVPPLVVPSTVDRRPSTISALRVFRPPLPASVIVRDGRPARLACPQRPTLTGDVTWCAGPWRSSGEWWNEQAWSREEWDVSLGDALYRIYRDTTGWFLGGSYD